MRTTKEIETNIKGLIQEEVCMGTYGLVELELRELKKSSYNQAIDDASKNAIVEVVDHEEIHYTTLPGYENNGELILPIYGVDDESILKLKIK